jgi:hypothetical protein
VAVVVVQVADVVRAADVVQVDAVRAADVVAVQADPVVPVVRAADLVVRAADPVVIVATIVARVVRAADVVRVVRAADVVPVVRAADVVRAAAVRTQASAAVRTQASAAVRMQASIKRTPAARRIQTMVSCRASVLASTTSVPNPNRTLVVRADIRVADTRADQVADVIAIVVHVAPIAPGIRNRQAPKADKLVRRNRRASVPTGSLCRRAASVRASRSVPMQMASDPTELPGIPSVVASAKPSVRRP